MTTPANWYPDPHNPGMLRWWDGYEWGTQTQPDPALQPPPPLAPQAYPNYQIPPYTVVPQAQAGPTASPGLRLGAYVLETILAVVTLGIGWLIWGAVVGGRGQTPAKQVLRLRVINSETGQPASLCPHAFPSRVHWQLGARHRGRYDLWRLVFDPDL